MHSKSDDDDGDDDEPMRDRMTVTGTHLIIDRSFTVYDSLLHPAVLSATGWRSSLGSSFQRRGEAWRKERLLTFKEEYKGGRARVTTSEERVLQFG